MIPEKITSTGYDLFEPGEELEVMDVVGAFLDFDY